MSVLPTEKPGRKKPGVESDYGFPVILPERMDDVVKAE
jgi:hypothetical protein